MRRHHVRKVFQPSLPARGATGSRTVSGHDGKISTLAPREGSDFRGHACIASDKISTLAPREGSDEIASETLTFYLLFQPSLPARGATINDWLAALTADISTLAPREGSDSNGCNIPTSSIISTLAPREGSDHLCHICFSAFHIFQPSLPARGATCCSGIYKA